MKPIIEIKIEKDRKQNTVVLMWNPSISSYTMDRFEYDLKEMSEGWPLDDFNWSVWEHDKARDGDKFVMVKVGPGTNGVVMSGVLSSEPYRGQDWSGKGRVVFYMDMEIHNMIHPDKCPLLTSEALTAEISDFDWSGGHSGRVLTEEQGCKLDELLSKYLKENDEIFTPRAARQDFD